MPSGTISLIPNPILSIPAGALSGTISLVYKTIFSALPSISFGVPAGNIRIGDTLPITATAPGGVKDAIIKMTTANGDESVFHGGAFGDKYQASTVSKTLTVWTFAIKRSGNWPVGSVVPKVSVFDALGQEVIA